MKRKIGEPEAIGSTTKISKNGSIKFAKIALTSSVQSGKSYRERIREKVSLKGDPRAEL